MHAICNLTVLGKEHNREAVILVFKSNIAQLSELPYFLSTAYHCFSEENVWNIKGFFYEQLNTGQKWTWKNGAADDSQQLAV